MIIKGCPRCGGDMFAEEDGRDRAYACLQCGRRTAPEALNNVRTLSGRKVA